jgi:hypothetical protein
MDTKLRDPEFVARIDDAGRIRDEIAIERFHHARGFGAILALTEPLSVSSPVSSKDREGTKYVGPRPAQSLAKGFLSEFLSGAEPRAARIMSMKARRPVGTCRRPG